MIDQPGVVRTSERQLINNALEEYLPSINNDDGNNKTKIASVNALLLAESTAAERRSSGDHFKWNMCAAGKVLCVCTFEELRILV